MQHRARQRQLLAHAMRVRLDQLVGFIGQLEQAQQRLGPLPSDLRRDLVQPAHEGEELAPGQLRVQVRRLGQIADTALDLARLLDHVEAGDKGRPTRRSHQPGQHADGRGLPRAVRSEETEHLTRLDLERHAADRDELAEAFRQPACLDNRRRHHVTPVCRTIGFGRRDFQLWPVAGTEPMLAARCEPCCRRCQAHSCCL